jgi:hypothetical protein
MLVWLNDQIKIVYVSYQSNVDISRNLDKVLKCYAPTALCISRTLCQCYMHEHKSLHLGL